MPREAELLSAANAVYSPGTIPAGMTPLRNANGIPIVLNRPSDGFYGAAFVTATGQ